MLPEAYLGVPVVALPATCLDNNAVLRRVRAAFEGPDELWPPIERRLRGVFRLCESDVRYLEEERPLPLADHVLGPSREALAAAGLGPADLDMLAYGAIAREYFEPATASEVAGKLGAFRALTFDVAAACSGSLMALQAALGHMLLQPRLKNALITTVAIQPGRIAWKMPDYETALLLAAGLTVGNASAAMTLTREPRGPCGRVVGVRSETLSEHWGLCRAPLDAPFVSHSIEIFALSSEVPGHLARLCEDVGWAPSEVDLFVAHQPSNKVLRKIMREFGQPEERAPGLHHLYGNTESAAVMLSLAHLHREGRIKPGMKLVLMGAAGGFTMASAALIWQG